MNKKFVYRALALIFFFVSIKETTAGIIPQSNDNPFLKRDTAAKTIAASAIFNNDVMGGMTFESTEGSGIMYVYGSFSKGFPQDCFGVLLKKDGKTAIDLTTSLNITVSSLGATNPFWAAVEFDLAAYLSINDKQKRQDAGTTADITNGAQTVSSAPVTALPV
ncbi:1377_t:CDS:1 [Dentiscutata heterogama]|uniref:1377_t:CDS:1 n=1 Tax=Dentiscutata heterogama TaxID=1316150 RepID=A0ACA9JW94_9GLOM|nr:1377_t:CDS:1 [Dentiscutata heterogama]